jgi:hypothetical protein
MSYRKITDMVLDHSKDNHELSSYFFRYFNAINKNSK